MCVGLWTHTHTQKALENFPGKKKKKKKCEKGGRKKSGMKKKIWGKKEKMRAAYTVNVFLPDQ